MDGLVFDTEFWSKVDKGTKDTDCWLWTLSCDNGGIPQYGFLVWPRRSRRRVNRKVNRAVYEETYQVKLSRKWLVRMRCGNRRCVNPNHMELMRSFASAHAAQWQNSATREDRLKVYADRIKTNVKIDPVRGCHIWLASRRGATLQYGRMLFFGKYVPAHHVAWAMAKNNWVLPPKGMVIMHKCDTPACVNPDHLELGTYTDNMQDMVKKGRQAKGERVADAIFNDEAIRSIFAEYVPRYGEVTRLAQKYGCSLSQMSAILHRKNWKHVRRPRGIKTKERPRVPGSRASGENHGNAVLTWAVVRKIRELHLKPFGTKHMGSRAIAKELGLSEGTVADVLYKKGVWVEPEGEK